MTGWTRTALALGLFGAALAASGCGTWTRAETIAIRAEGPVQEPGPFFDRLVAALHRAGYPTHNANRVTGTVEVDAKHRENGRPVGSFVLQAYFDGAIEITVRGPERQRRRRRARDGRMLGADGRLVLRALQEESVALADRLARELDAEAMTEPVARLRMDRGAR